MYRAQLLDKKNTNRYPVVTIVLYFGEGHWRVPKKLTQCLNIPEDFKPFVNEYKIRVYEIAHLPRKIIDKFESDFRIVVEYYWLKHHNKDFRGTDRQIEYVDAFFKTMRALTGDDRYMQILQALDQEQIIAQGGVSVCEMLERLEKRGEARGRAEGEARGRVEGRAEGEAKGRAEGRIAAIVVGVRNMVNKMKMSAEEAMDMFNVAPADRPTILAAL